MIYVLLCRNYQRTSHLWLSKLLYCFPNWIKQIFTQTILSSPKQILSFTDSDIVESKESNFLFYYLNSTGRKMGWSRIKYKAAQAVKRVDGSMETSNWILVKTETLFIKKIYWRTIDKERKSNLWDFQNSSQESSWKYEISALTIKTESNILAVKFKTCVFCNFTTSWWDWFVPIHGNCALRLNHCAEDIFPVISCQLSSCCLHPAFLPSFLPVNQPSKSRSEWDWKCLRYFYQVQTMIFWVTRIQPWEECCFSFHEKFNINFSLNNTTAPQKAS